ncbi:hypothetical protein Zmor_000280 [Zophobas morio]|uniref:Uncharacterized protein n=1 Tax=Zophobas morio TaxID=2755281 RepID=A0AA38IUH9_9CUCU|nr:hypothetical protein Zmor_024742 [Zophobas morio]KAJ3653980.1 hypothetical protein Zmor_013198 [Zophobas morio]KAJ3663737.1 hypothetical protein Zmor_007964 [Zophobas morio]KAJ3664734.1 hypothetical protein Zmor_000280 [Zophobas morio]
MECLHHNKTATSESTSVKIGDEETSITETVISFLKSNTFSSILRKAIEAATVSLRDEIRSLKQELNNVKSSNVDMIKMLTDYPKNNLLKVPSFDVDVFSDISSDGINDTNEWKKKYTIKHHAIRVSKTDPAKKLINSRKFRRITIINPF